MSNNLNTYDELQIKVRKADLELEQYKDKCAVVNINASTCNTGIRWLHRVLALNFENLIYSRRISDGSQNRIMLIAPKTNIADALELSIAELKDHLVQVNVTSLETIISELRTTHSIFPRLDFIDET